MEPKRQKNRRIGQEATVTDHIPVCRHLSGKEKDLPFSGSFPPPSNEEGLLLQED